MKKYIIAASGLILSASAAMAQATAYTSETVVDPSALLNDTKSVADTALTAGIALGVTVIGWRLIKRFIRS